MNNLFRSMLFILGFIFAIPIHTFSQVVIIPDVNFRTFLLGQPSINTNSDGNIQVAEAAAYTGTLNVNNLSIADLTGIEAFTSITELSCNNNNLTSLDVSTIPTLSILWCTYNNLNTLNINGATALTELYCFDNQLVNLNTSTNVGLTILSCASNDLVSLDVSANTSLTNFYCENNNLTVLDVSTNTSLLFLYCNGNNLTNLIITNTDYPFSLKCGGNQFTNLNLTSNSALAYLDCGGNNLSSLDLSGNLAITYLNCYMNNLTSLNVSANSLLTQVFCRYNQLQCLNVKNGNNYNFVGFSADNNLSLTCIEVDDAAYSSVMWTQIDTIANFSTNCGTACSIGIESENWDAEFNTFPNPVTNFINITTPDTKTQMVEIINVIGEIVVSKEIDFEKNSPFTLDLSSFDSGIYFLKVGHSTRKIIKQ